jgi:hypothetical protein
MDKIDHLMAERNKNKKQPKGASHTKKTLKKTFKLLKIGSEKT